MLNPRLNAPWWALRLGLGLGLIVTGVDKYFDKLTSWGMYLSPLATRVVPLSDTVFLRAVGVFEVAVGVLILTRWTRLGAYLLMLWLAAIAVNLVSTGMFFDLAMRDIEMALGAFALARLTEARTAVPAPAETAPASRVRNAAL